MKYFFIICGILLLFFILYKVWNKKKTVIKTKEVIKSSDNAETVNGEKVFKPAPKEVLTQAESLSNHNTAILSAFNLLQTKTDNMEDHYEKVKTIEILNDNIASDDLLDPVQKSMLIDRIHVLRSFI